MDCRKAHDVGTALLLERHSAEHRRSHDGGMSDDGPDMILTSPHALFMARAAAVMTWLRDAKPHPRGQIRGKLGQEPELR